MAFGFKVKCAVLAGVAFASIGAADPLTARIEDGDALRFAAVFAASNGAPDAARLQSGYLDGAGEGVAVFTPDRIVSAANLARAVRADPDRYAPQFAGLCAAGVAAGKRVEANPELWAIVNGRLYVFASLKAKETLEKDPDAVLARAHGGWRPTGR